MVVCALVCGCGEEEKIVFDEISRLPVREEMVELEIGSFIIPIPVVLDDSAERFEADNLIQVEFDLFAVVAPRHSDQVNMLLEQREGRIRDMVIRVCRNTAPDDILEAEWGTLKAHLIDAIQPLLGGQVLRRLVVPTVQKEEL